MNIIISCCGRRVFLIKELKLALKKIFPLESHHVVVTEASPYAPSCFYADKFVFVPLIKDDNYIKSIVNACISEDIDGVIPCKDTELVKFAKAKKDFPSKIKFNLSDQTALEVCEDKLLFYDTLKGDFLLPKTKAYDVSAIDELSFPLILKEQGVGVETSGATVCEDQDMLYRFGEQKSHTIISEYIQGQEYTVDCIFDKSHNPVVIIPRKRVALRNNISDVGVTIKDKKIIELSAKLGKKLYLLGAVNIQWIKRFDDEVFLVEVNPRISGGMQISIASCPDYVELLVRVLFDQPVSPVDFQENILTMKYDEIVSCNVEQHEFIKETI